MNISRDESAGRQHSQYVPKKLHELNIGHHGGEDTERANHAGKCLSEYEQTITLKSCENLDGMNTPLTRTPLCTQRYSNSRSPTTITFYQLQIQFPRLE